MFGIDYDEFFTKEEIIELSEGVCETLSMDLGQDIQLLDVYMEKGEHLFLTVINENTGYEYTTDVKIDMRKIKKPSDLMKYIPILSDRLSNQMKEDIEGSCKIEAEDNIDLSEYKFTDNKDGYLIYRKVIKENGELRGIWVAQDQDRKYPPFRITYDQARGFDPITKYDTPIQKLSRDLGKMLLPNSSCDIKSSEEFDEYEDEIKEIDQEFTSENTSINSTKLPAVFNMVKFEPGTVNLDYGGGRFDNVADYLSQYDVINLVYDPYNRSKDHNRDVVAKIKSHGGADTATCSNVLNVIKEPEVRLNVLRNISKLLKPNGAAYITVYEGSGKGDEGPTKSGYQLNRKTADYLEEIQQVFPDATRKGKLIVCHPGTVTSSTNIFSSQDDVSDILNGLMQEVESEAIKFMQLPNIGFSENEAKEYLRVDGYYSDEYFVIEVGAELSYGALMELANTLDKVVEYYDSYAYFDAEAPGILVTFINPANLDIIESSTNTCNIAVNPKFTGLYEIDSARGFDVYDQVTVDFSGYKLILEEDGHNWDIVDDKGRRAFKISDKFYLDDTGDVVDGIEITEGVFLELVDPSKWENPGEYILEGSVKLVYGLIDEGDFAEIELDKNKSDVSDLEIIPTM